MFEASALAYACFQLASALHSRVRPGSVCFVADREKGILELMVLDVFICAGGEVSTALPFTPPEFKTLLQTPAYPEVVPDFRATNPHQNEIPGEVFG